MTNKLMIILGLMCIPLPAMASHANANASAMASAANVAGAETDVKRGMAASNPSSVSPAAKAPVLSDEARKKGYSYTAAEITNIQELCMKSSLDEFRAALDRGEIIPMQWIHNAPILHCAVAWDASAEKIALLIDRGADISELDEYGQPILHALFYGPATNARVKNFILLYTKGADITVDHFEGSYPPQGKQIVRETMLHTLCLLNGPVAQKFIEACVVLGVNLEAVTNNWGHHDSQLNTPLWKTIYLFHPQEMGDCRSIEALVGCGADITHVEDFIRQGIHKDKPNCEAMIRERLKKGEEIFVQKQLPLVVQELQQTFATYPDGQLFGKELAPIINAYAGRLILPRRVYTDAEKRKALDELVEFSEAEEKRQAQQATQPAEQTK
jgi:hypothetical protein